MSKQFTLRFDTGNAAFGDTPEQCNEEIVHILRTIAARIEDGDRFDTYRNIMDTNGNIVGTFALKERSGE
jgi:hypothetical protein